MKPSDDMPDFDQIFGNLNPYSKKLSPEQEAGLKLMELAKKFPKSDNQK